MASVPAPVKDYLEQINIATRVPAFLLLREDGMVLEAGGELSYYGLADSCGQPLPETWRFLTNFLPLEEESLDLPRLKLDSRDSVDLHLVRSEGGVFVVFLDARAQEASQRSLQQKTNELSLLEGRQQKLLRQYIGSGIAESLLQEIWDPAGGGERRVVTTMFADIRGFTPYSEASPPEQVFRTLNAYLGVMLEPVLAQGGWVDKLVGDQVMALFGLVKAEAAPAVQAVQAAHQIVQNVRELYARGKVHVGLDIGIGITTGPVALGIMGTRERRSFTAIGHNVNLAARLESQAQRGEILIDEASYEQLGQHRQRFSRKMLLLKGVSVPIAAYSCTAS